MTDDTIHTCSYSCERPGCIRAQRDELVAKVEALRAEVERLRADRDSWEQQASDRVADWHAEHLRAERLAEEVDALRAEVAAWRELSDHVRVGACAAIWPDRYTDARTRDVAAALKRAERMEEALREVMLWIENWSPPFTEDDEWPDTEAKAQAALAEEDE